MTFLTGSASDWTNECARRAWLQDPLDMAATICCAIRRPVAKRPRRARVNE